MKPITIVGAGKIGLMIAELLATGKSYQITLIDRDENALKRVQQEVPSVKTRQIDAQDQSALMTAFADQFAVINSCPFDQTRNVATAAVAQQVHYLDLTEDVASTRAIKKLASDAESALIPQCGLAPGFISIVANDLAKKFDSLRDVHMRVGALPKYPSNGLKYNLTWSTDGLINEYLNPCEAIVDGELVEVPPLEELELFSLDGDDYEAFNTSGGLGTLCESLAGQVKNLNYRTVRYPGHRDVMKLLLKDLGLGERRELLKDILETSIPVTMQDVVLIFVSVSGMRNGLFVQETFAQKVYSRVLEKNVRSAIQITTASGICGALDLLVEGKVPNRGFVRQEDINLSDFLQNRYGKNFLIGEHGKENQHFATDAPRNVA